MSNLMPGAIDFPYPDAVLFGPDDDSVHAAGPAPDWTETTWWSFNVPERGLGGWLYIQMRPNLGVSSGGAFVYGPDRWMSSEQPYYAYFHHLPLPDSLDLRDVTFRNGVSVQMLEPGMKYRLGYQFRDQQEFTADLLFEGLTPPVPHLHGAPPFTGSSHYDQHGRVTGTLHLNGETIAVDCIAVRDRSWGRRPELVGLSARRLSYVFGASSPDEAFLVFCQPPADDQLAETETLSSGYLLRDGKLRRLASATRVNTRDPATGGVSSLAIDAVDTDGRSLTITGEAVSRLALVNANLCVGTILRFSIDGREGWGEDQDVWPHARFAQMRRAAEQ
jgi:hypothetical protein